MGCHLASLEEYLETLDLGRPGAPTREEVMSALIAGTGKATLLPLIALLPEAWRSAVPTQCLTLMRALGTDVITPVFMAMVETTAASVFAGLSMQSVRDLKEVSPAAGAAAMAQAKVAAEKSKGGGSLSPLLYAKDEKAPGLPDLPNPFVLDRDLSSVAKSVLAPGVDPNGFDVVEGKEIAPEMLPTLRLAPVGRAFTLTRRQCAENRVMAGVFNGLSGNAIPGGVLEEVGAAGRETFKVRLHESGEDLTDTVSLLEALEAEGHWYDVSFESRTTSFGASLCFRDEGLQDEVHVAVAFPLRTGIVRVGGEGPNDQVLTILPHCSAVLKLKGPLMDKVVLQVNQGVEGFQGWFAMNECDRPWQNSYAHGAVARSDPPLSPAEALRVVALAAVGSVAANTVSVRQGFLLGGYGSMGVCIDSTAVLETALRGRTTMFPVTVAGAFRQAMVDMLDELATSYKEAGGAEAGKRVDCCQDLRRAVFNLPQDTSVDPQGLESACRRVLRNVPPGSALALADEAREDVEAALRHARAKG